MPLCIECWKQFECTEKGCDYEKIKWCKGQNFGQIDYTQECVCYPCSIKDVDRELKPIQKMEGYETTQKGW